MKFLLFSFLIFFDIWIFLYAQDYNVRNFNATGDGKTDDTSAVRAAFQAAAMSNGGRVIFDAGYTFLTGTMTVTSNVIIDVQGVILGSQEFDEFHYPIVDGRRRAFIQITDSTNITLTGGGVVDGQGNPWWVCSWDLKLPPCNSGERPTFVQFDNCTNIIVHDITLKDSPAWCLSLEWVTGAHIYNLNITTPDLPIAHNTDGMDIESSVDVLVENYHYQGSDDAVTVGSGSGTRARLYGRASENVLVRNCTIFNSSNSAMSIGSPTSGGVRNVTYENVFANGTGAAAKIKGYRGLGGIVQDITWNNFTVYNVKDGGVVWTAFYKGGEYINDDETPKYKNLRVTNMVIDGGANGWHLFGLPESPFRAYFANITVKNINNTNYYSRCSGTDGLCDGQLSPSCPPCLNAECPTNWTRSSVTEMKCYRLYNQSFSFENAQNSCRNGLLLTSLNSIDSSFDNSDIANFANKNHPECTKIYIGLQKCGNSWTWINGDNSTYQNWATGYPINDPNANCVVLNPKAGTWTNQDCSLPQCYICGWLLNSP